MKRDDIMLFLDDIMFNAVKIGLFESSATCIYHACFPVVDGNHLPRKVHRVVERSAARILPRYP